MEQANKQTYVHTFQKLFGLRERMRILLKECRAVSFSMQLALFVLYAYQKESGFIKPHIGYQRYFSPLRHFNG
jgi:hypothetical protein